MKITVKIKRWSQKAKGFVFYPEEEYEAQYRETKKSFIVNYGANAAFKKILPKLYRDGTKRTEWAEGPVVRGRQIRFQLAD